jgi:uncharacterized membrane protein YidH (DUF202 family)
MAARRVVGFVLIALGIVALLYGGISWTREKTVIDAGPVEIRADQRETIPLPPVLGGIAVIAGALLLVLPGRK